MYEYKQTSFAFEGKFNKNNYLFLQEQDKFQTNTCVQENLGKFLLRKTPAIILSFMYSPKKTPTDKL